MLDSGYDVYDLYKDDKFSLEDTKENLDRHKRAFEDRKKSYGIDNQNDMTCIHNNRVNNKMNAIYNMT